MNFQIKKPMTPSAATPPATAMPTMEPMDKPSSSLFLSLSEVFSLPSALSVALADGRGLVVVKNTVSPPAFVDTTVVPSGGGVDSGVRDALAGLVLDGFVSSAGADVDPGAGVEFGRLEGGDEGGADDGRAEGVVESSSSGTVSDSCACTVATKSHERRRVRVSLIRVAAGKWKRLRDG